MKFVIRDDDLNYFSTPTDIEYWYTDIFTRGIPVGFSAIPFINPKRDAHAVGKSFEDREYPIGANKELINYVERNPLIEILQHGTTHGTMNGIFEYRKRTGLIEDTRRGKEELQKAFGEKFKPIFVPPHDWIGSHGIYAIEAAKLDVIRGRGAGLRNWIPRWAYLKIFFKMLAYRLSHIFKNKVPAYPHVLDFGKHKEVCSYRLEDTDIFDGLAYAQRKNGIFIVVAHLHPYTAEQKERLMQLIEKAHEYGAEFVAPRALFIER